MKDQVIVILIGLGTWCAVPNAVNGETQTCVPNTNGPEVCVGWDNPNPPALPDDFLIDYSNPAKPVLELLTGSLTWRAWSKDPSDPDEPGDLHTIKTFEPYHFGVTLARPNGTAGAEDVYSVNLQPEGDHHSSIAAGSKIGHLVGPLTVQQDSGKNGGAVSLTIEGDAEGQFTIPKLLSLTIEGDLSGDITVSDKIDNGSLTVRGDVTSTAYISIADTTSDTTLEFNTSGYDGDLDFAGDLFMYKGVQSWDRVVIHGKLTSTASVDLNGQNVAADLHIGAAESGSSITGGAVTGNALVWLAMSYGGWPWRANNFSGTATFASVDGPEISTAGSAGGIDGTIRITGDMSGMIGTAAGQDNAAGSLLAGGKISIGGDCSGIIYVGTDAAGDITVEGDVIYEGSKNIQIDGMLKSTGRIMVDGMYDGVLEISKETESLSLIRLKGGLGAGGQVTVNTTAGAYDANGTIQVGTPFVPCLGLPDPVTFDGSIMILEQSGGGDGGDLKGMIRVTGCHDDTRDLDICICGGDGYENVVLVQSSCSDECENQVDWSCVTGCP